MQLMQRRGKGATERSRILMLRGSGSANPQWTYSLIRQTRSPISNSMRLISHGILSLVSPMLKSMASDYRSSSFWTGQKSPRTKQSTLPCSQRDCAYVAPRLGTGAELMLPQELGSYFGAHSVHAGLWESATDTAHSLSARIAIIHLVAEARGIDMNPLTMARLKSAGDKESSRVLEIIHADEITRELPSLHRRSFSSPLPPLMMI